jgi:ribose transport system ATP-binding protein
MAELVKNDIIRPEKGLKMEGIHKYFGATKALVDVSFYVVPGEVHALVGENGAGKSTLMKVLSGACQADKGSIYLDGELFRPRNPIDSRKKGIGMIYQELSLAPHLTVEENVCLGVEPTRYSLVHRSEVRDRTTRAFNYFNHPEIKPDMQVGNLSVSAQQLVEIARALSLGCKILVLDEPTSSLSQSDVIQLFNVIKILKEQGLSIIYISHFLEEVQEIADRLTVLRDGKVVGTHNLDQISSSEIVNMMVGRDVYELYPRSKRTAGEEILKVENLAGIHLPKEVSLTLHKGEVLGVFGLIGAGRTEFLRTLFGLDLIKQGQIQIASFTGTGTPQERWRQGAGMMSENRKEEGLVPGMSIADNVTLSKLKGFGSMNLVFPHNQNKAVLKWIEYLDIRCSGPDQSIDELSGGNQQKSVFGRLLQHDVDLFLLDEPTRGIDVASKAKIYEAINKLACETDTKGQPRRGLLIISSYIPELLGVCDRIAVMSKGKLGVVKKVDEINEHYLMAAATGQTAIA